MGQGTPWAPKESKGYSRRQRHDRISREETPCDLSDRNTLQRKWCWVFSGDKHLNKGGEEGMILGGVVVGSPGPKKNRTK